MQLNELTILYRPVGPEELELIKQTGWTKFPPRLSEQPIFYPVMNEDYAIQIARDWNVPASGAGFVTKFAIKAEYISKYEVQNVGGESTVADAILDRMVHTAHRIELKGDSMRKK